MFNAGTDQADGLKRLFRPLAMAKVDVIGLTSDPMAGELANRIGHALAGMGLIVHWEDPVGLLTTTATAMPDQPMRAGRMTKHRNGSTLARSQDYSASSATRTGTVVVAARRHTPLASHQEPDAQIGIRTVCSVFAARAEPRDLPALYAAIKATDVHAQGQPVTVVWANDGTGREAQRKLCEVNLERTVNRFLARPLQFYRASGAGNSPLMLDRILGGDSRPAFFQGLTDMVLAHFGPAVGRRPLYQN